MGRAMAHGLLAPERFNDSTALRRVMVARPVE